MINPRFGIAVTAERAVEPLTGAAASSGISISFAGGHIEVIGQRPRTSATLPNGDTFVVRDGDCFIDGVKVPTDATRFTAKTSGNIYLIERTGDHISLRTE